jgi:prepilin-type N-terminal cleavage/methylation domain-containing protein
MGTRVTTQDGFTLIEVLVAVAVMSFGVAATLRVFGSADRATLNAQQHEVAIQQAQAEVDRLAALPYGELALTAAPAYSSDPVHPNHRVNGTSFNVRPDLVEPLVTTPAEGSTAQVNPGPEAFTVGSNGAAVTGNIHRYVTWRDEPCPAGTGICDGAQNTKRVVVALTVDPVPGGEPRDPVWMSTLLIDPAAAGFTNTSGGATGPDTSAQLFYLYDTPCGQTARMTPTVSHATRSTAAASASAASASTCQNADPTRNPDLMGTTAPDEITPPLFTYSTDLTGGYTGGLAMMQSETSCRRSYPAADETNTAVANKWSVHAWSTNPFGTPFTLSGRLTLSIHTHAVVGTTGAAKVCATLVDRVESGGQATDTVITTATHDVSNWPATPRRLRFTTSLASPVTVPAGHRLVLALHVRSESEHDIALRYDHPDHPSLLEVETSTPL